MTVSSVVSSTHIHDHVVKDKWLTGAEVCDVMSEGCRATTPLGGPLHKAVNKEI